MREPRIGFVPSLAGMEIAGLSLAEIAQMIVPLLDLVPAMVSVKDTESRYRFMNAFQARLFGTSPDLALGRTAADLLGEAYGAYASASDQRVIDSGVALPPYEEEYADASGTLHDWLTTKVPLRDHSGRIVAVGTLAVEITAQKRAQRALEQGLSSLDLANRSKTRFMAEIAHEVRTPLHAVLGFTDLLRRQRFGPLGDPRYLRFADDIALSAEHLRALADDMIDMSRTEVGQLTLTEETVGIGTMFDQAVRLVSMPISAKALRLERIEPPAIRLRVDPRRVVQVLTNLLSNAAKFTPRTGRVLLRAEERPDGSVAMVVEDSGPGIAPDQVAEALAPFSRLPGSSGVEGAGIGLPLAAGLVSRHGGRLELTPGTGGEGTRAAAVFPARRVVR